MFQKTLTNDSARALGALMFHAAHNAQPAAEGVDPTRRAELALASAIRTIFRAALEPSFALSGKRIGSALGGAALEASRSVAKCSIPRAMALAWVFGKLQEPDWSKMSAGALMAQILVFNGPLQDNGNSAFYMHLDPAVSEDVGQLKKKDLTPAKLVAELQAAYPKAAIIYR